MDAFIDQDKGCNLTDFAAEHLHGWGPSSVLLLDIIIQKWVLHDSLGNNSSYNPTENVQISRFINDPRLRDEHSDGQEYETDHENLLAWPDLVHVTEKDGEEDTESHGYYLDNKHVFVDFDRAFLRRRILITFFHIYEPNDDCR